MFFKQIISYPYGQNCYIIADENTKKGAVIDPGGSRDEILAAVKENHLEIEYIILTHCHFDHIMAVEEVRAATGAKVVIHADDAEGLANPAVNMSHVIGRGAVGINTDIRAQDGDVLVIGSLTPKLIHTPGHTRGGMCILVDDRLFSGDTLFSLDIGRTDLPGGDYNTLINSVKKLFTLPEDVKVYPGHDRASSIGRERRENPYIK